jgi:hypothetical protein
MGLKPLFPAEPSFLAFRVLSGCGIDGLLAGGAVKCAGEQCADFAEADGFFAVDRDVCEGGDFIESAAGEHGACALGDARVEVWACALDDESAELGRNFMGF